MECKGYKVNQRVFNIIIVTPLLTLTLVIIIVVVITLARAQYRESVECKGKERVRSIQQSTQGRETGHNRQQAKGNRENRRHFICCLLTFFLCFFSSSFAPPSGLESCSLLNLKFELPVVD
jgi:hypothetical protein